MVEIKNLKSIDFAKSINHFSSAYFFSDFLFFKEFKEDNEEFITDLKSDFDKGVFKKPLVGLISSMKKAQKD